ncbi:MAG: dienelactone hydrolase family protein [Deltaproteobacteria bacterium]|jgi:dienelactone hydrolase|nr:dienelactone hydrolase family protein [Deltaproteobacteria bacterium]
MGQRRGDLSRRGPYAVGIVQAEPSAFGEPERRLPTDVWYPARQGHSRGAEAPHPFGRPHSAEPGLPPIDTPCPLILFSHGNSGLRRQSTFLTTHLASWGYVVAAPDHVGNTFEEMAAITSEEERRSVHLEVRDRRPRDLLGVLRALLDEDLLAARRPPLQPHPVGVLGHSFGGWTALKLPRLEPRVRALCCLAPASEPFVGRRAFEPDELPLPDHVSALVLAAREDVLVDLETSVRPLARRLGEGARLEVIERADHFHFCDGIEFLHALHMRTPREGQRRPTLPLEAVQGEEEMHADLTRRVTRFFDETLEHRRDGRGAEAPRVAEGESA